MPDGDFQLLIYDYRINKVLGGTPLYKDPADAIWDAMDVLRDQLDITINGL